MMTKWELWDFYLEYCVDEDKGETPLSYKEWEKEIYPLDKKLDKSLDGDWKK